MIVSYKDMILNITYNMFFLSIEAILRLEHLEYVVKEPQGSVRVCVILQNSHPDIDQNDEGACYIGYSLYLLFITKADTAS